MRLPPLETIIWEGIIPLLAPLTFVTVAGYALWLALTPGPTVVVPASLIAEEHPTYINMCQIDITDGVIVIEPDGTLKSYVMIDGEIYGMGTFVPCRYLHRNRPA